jgi:hypothetical protein
MRLYGLDLGEVEEVVLGPGRLGHDRRGNLVYARSTRTGRTLTVVIALDEPDLVVTVFEEER